MKKRIRSDSDFETAFLSRATVFVKPKASDEEGYIGGLEGFNPLFVTVGGKLFWREDCDFTTIRQ